MDSHPPALSAQIAGLRHAVQATPAAAWLPATLHALIIACLARLFTRLEQMLNIWQSGDLILPQATPRAAASREQRPGPPPAVSNAAARPQRPAGVPAISARAKPPRQRPRAIPVQSTAPPPTSHPPRNTARAPPAILRPKTADPLPAVSPKHAHIITI